MSNGPEGYSAEEVQDWNAYLQDLFTEKGLEGFSYQETGWRWPRFGYEEAARKAQAQLYMQAVEWSDAGDHTLGFRAEVHLKLPKFYALLRCRTDCLRHLLVVR